MTRADLNTLGVNAARRRLMDSLTNGVALASYIGHSGPTAWSFKGLFSASDAAGLAGHGRPSVVAQWGCWNTYHVAPAYDTMSHKLMLADNGGVAAAVMGAATLTDSAAEEQLGSLLLPRLVTKATGDKLNEEWQISKVKLNPNIKPERFEKKEKK